MNKNLIYVILLIFGALIAYLILGDAFKSDISGKSSNPYAYDLGDIRKVDPAMLKYKEVKRISLPLPKPKVIDYYKGMLAIGYENHLQLIDTLGTEIFTLPVESNITAICISPEGFIFLGCTDHIEKYDQQGNMIDRWEAQDTSTFITSIAFKNEQVFIADARGPVVRRFSAAGEKELEIDGKGRVDSEHGFIVPSPYFDVDFDPDGQLWVANTGMQYIENYSDEGSLRAYWGKSAFSLEGFTGCCNPAHFIIMANGNFVTCEKGMVRIKVYFPSGELESVVAAPDDFDNDSEPLDLTSDELNRIYALDITRKMIRKFERKNT
jgi:hypothetical protein